MSFQVYSNSLTALHVLLCILLLYRLASHSVWRHFPLFTLCVLWEISGSIISTTIILVTGYDSVFHGRFYEVAGFFGYFLLLGALLEAAKKLQVEASAWLVGFMVAIGAFLSLHLQSIEGLNRLSNVIQGGLLHVGVSVAAAIALHLVRRSSLGIGTNLAGILAMLVTIVACHWSINAALTIGGIPYSVARWLIQPAGLTAVAFAFARMGTLELPLPIASVGPEGVRR